MKWRGKLCEEERLKPVRPAGATSLPRRHLVLLRCPVPADLTAFGLPVLGRCSRLRDREKTRTLRLLRYGGPPAACHLLRRRQAAAGDHCYVGRRDSPSASLRTRHVSLVRALALETATRISGRRTVPPFGRSRPVGRSENQDQEMKPEIGESGSVGEGDGCQPFLRATSIGVPPLSPLPATRAYRRHAAGCDKKQQYVSTNDMIC